jgi:hypothetical protein
MRDRRSNVGGRRSDVGCWTRPGGPTAISRWRKPPEPAHQNEPRQGRSCDPQKKPSAASCVWNVSRSPSKISRIGTTHATCGLEPSSELMRLRTARLSLGRKSDPPRDGHSSIVSHKGTTPRGPSFPSPQHVLTSVDTAPLFADVPSHPWRRCRTRSHKGFPATRTARPHKPKHSEEGHKCNTFGD